jgi:hypothetical protein
LSRNKCPSGHSVSDHVQRKRRNHQLPSIPISIDRYDDYHDASQFDSEFYHFYHIFKHLEYLNPCEQLFNRIFKLFAINSDVTIEHVDEIR